MFYNISKNFAGPKTMRKFAYPIQGDAVGDHVKRRRMTFEPKAWFHSGGTSPSESWGFSLTIRKPTETPAATESR